MKSAQMFKSMFRSSRKQYKSATNIIRMMLAGNMRQSAIRALRREK